MTEIFAAVRDASERALLRVVHMTVDALPALPRPWYLPEILPPSRAAARAQMDALIAKGRRRQP